MCSTQVPVKTVYMLRLLLVACSPLETSSSSNCITCHIIQGLVCKECMAWFLTNKYLSVRLVSHESIFEVQANINTLVFAQSENIQRGSRGGNTL